MDQKETPKMLDCPEKLARRQTPRARLNVKWRYDHEPRPDVQPYYTTGEAQQGVALRRGGSPARLAAGVGADGGNYAVRDDANDYVKKYGPIFGLKPLTPSVRRELDEDLARRTADAFDAMPHDPQNPAVKDAYDQLKREILAQYEHIMSRGNLKISPWMREGQPYRNSQDMRNDVRNLKHMWFFPTVSPHQEHSFGATGGDLDPKNNPLVERTGHVVDGYKMTYNDMLRAVHDYYGHAKDGYEFGPAGELNAWSEHAKMFSSLATKALTTETHGQNSWVNFGRHLRRPDGSMPSKGDPDYVHPKDRPYAEQKVNILPPEATPQLPDSVVERMHRAVGSMTRFVKPIFNSEMLSPFQHPSLNGWTNKRLSHLHQYIMHDPDDPDRHLVYASELENAANILKKASASAADISKAKSLCAMHRAFSSDTTPWEDFVTNPQTQIPKSELSVLDRIEGEKIRDYIARKKEAAAPKAPRGWDTL